MGETREYRYFSYEALKQANSRAIRAGRNRTLEFERLPIDPTKIYPVILAIPHERAPAYFAEMRVEIVLNNEGERVFLDLSQSEYDGLPVAELVST
mgnify:CR=1 FL=1